MLEFLKRLLPRRPTKTPTREAALREPMAGRQRAEGGLGRSVEQQQEWLRVTLASIGDAVIATDTGGRVTFLNPVAAELTGWTQEEAQGQPLAAVFPILNEQTRQPVENPVDKVLRHGAIVGLGNHTVLTARDGTERPIDDAAAPIKDAAGRLIGVVLTFRDVTEQRRAERELRESESRNRAVLETALDCIIMMDHEGKVLEFNPAAEKTFGYRRDQVIGRELADFIIPPSLRERHHQGMARYLATGEGPVLGKRLKLPGLRADGSEFPLELAITRIPTDGPPLFTAYLRDVTYEKQTEQYRNVRLSVTHALADAAGVLDGAGGVLEAVCAGLGWELGFFWTVNERGSALVCRKSWQHPDAPLTEFESASWRRTFVKGEGLPGRVWDSGQSAWILDIAHDTNFPRLAMALRCGLHSAVACPVVVGDRTLGVIEFFTRCIRQTDADLLEMLGTVAGALAQFIERRRAEEDLRRQTAIAETLNRIGSLLAAELDPQRLVQVVTDEGTKLCGAQFGAFFYNVVGERGESYTLYTLSGAPREAFADFPMPRNTAIFSPTFRGDEIVRLNDVTQDPRYGKNTPYQGMPQGHLPVRSYLAVPVVSRSGEVLGGLFFGHAEAGVFTEDHERLLSGVAGQAAVAIDNARLYKRAQATAERLNLALSAAALGDWSWDAASDVVTFSERAADMFGIPSGPHMTWTAMQGLLHPDDRDRARFEVERAVTERVQYDIEYRVQRPDGSQVWVAAMGRATYDGSGQIQGMFGLVRDITDRKRGEEALRHSEERFRSLMEQAPFSIQVFSPDGRTVRVNRAWEELWGVRLEQIEGYNILEDKQLEARGILHYIHEGFAGRATRIPAIQYDPNETIPGITQETDPRRWLSAMIYPIKDGDGKVREVILVHEDITARHRAEDALRQSEQRFRQLADAMPQIVWTAGPDGQIDYLNHRWTEFTGLPQTVSNEGWGPLLHPDEARLANERWAASVRSGAPFEMEIRLLDRRRQTYRWHLIRSIAVKDEAGAVVRWFGTSTDIHRQKRAEESSRYLAEASVALASVVDYESTLQKVAKLAVPYFADWSTVDIGHDGILRRLAVAHQDPSKIDLVHRLMQEYPPDPQAPVGAYAVLRTGKPEFIAEIMDDILVESARDERHLSLIRSLGLQSYICMPLVVSGKTFGVLTFATAESGRRYDEADLALATDLAHRVAVAIENAQLYQALREADRRKDEFLATLAHELRNPLAPIRNSLQILKMPRVDSATVERSREMMERQVHHLVRMVDDLLDVSRVMRGKIELRREQVELATVVARAVETVQPLIDAQGHELIVRLPPESLPLDADPVRLSQVVSNLLTNAAKYTEQSERIWLTAERDGPMAVLRVRDTGIGISPNMLHRIFELFVQVDHASTKAQGGLGIGLTLVKNLVEMHNGTVEAHSAGLGRGSEFVVRLPLATQNLAVNRLDETSQQTPETPLPSGFRVLVVDDNQDAADSLATLLRLQGHEVGVAYSGLAALEMAKVTAPDVVFLDIGMPGMDGYEVARRLRHQPGLENVVLAALTGWGQPQDRRRTAEAGFNHHLVKPPEPKALEYVIGELEQRSLQ